MASTYNPTKSKKKAEKAGKAPASDPDAQDNCFVYKPAKSAATTPQPVPVAQPMPCYYMVAQPQYAYQTMYAPEVAQPVSPGYFYYIAPDAPAPTLTKPYGSPDNPYVWNGNSKAEIDRQNMVIAQNTGANKPTKLMPVKAKNNQQWWCRELDGSYTLRSTNTISEALQPGYWAEAKDGGTPYFIRTA